MSRVFLSRRWLGLLGAWLAGWLVAVVSLSTLHWTSPAQPPSWPLEGPFYVAVPALWTLIPAWIARSTAARLPGGAGARWVLGASAGLGGALLNTAVGTVALRGPGEPDSDGLWTLVGLLVAAAASAIGALIGALRRDSRLLIQSSQGETQ